MVTKPFVFCLSAMRKSANISYYCELLLELTHARILRGKRERDRDRQTDRQTDRASESERERETDGQTDRLRHRESARASDRERETETETHRQTQRESESERARERERERGVIGWFMPSQPVGLYQGEERVREVLCKEKL